MCSFKFLLGLTGSYGSTHCDHEPILLRIQYAAREYYNKAERLNYCVWLIILASAFAVFLPTSWPTAVTLGIPFVAELLAFFLMRNVCSKVKKASRLRNYFDAYVLDISLDNYEDSDLRKIREISNKIYSGNPEKAEIQMCNSGRDNPPGVRDWYVFSKCDTEVCSQFECQRQNAWWDKKMVKTTIILSICALILVLIPLGFLLLKTNVVLILCLAGVFIKLVETLVENIRYHVVSEHIEGALLVVGDHPSEYNIERIQKLIDERRSLTVLGFNWFHKKNANTFSKEYEDVTS